MGTNSTHRDRTLRAIGIHLTTVVLVAFAGASVVLAAPEPPPEVDPSAPRDQSDDIEAATDARRSALAAGGWTIGLRNQFGELVTGAESMFWLVGPADVNGGTVTEIRWDFGAPNAAGFQQVVATDPGTPDAPSVLHVYERTGAVTVSATVVVEAPATTRTPAPSTAGCGPVADPNLGETWASWTEPMDCAPPMVPVCAIGDALVPPVRDADTGDVIEPVTCQGPDVDVPPQRVETDVLLDLTAVELRSRGVDPDGLGGAAGATPGATAERPEGIRMAGIDYSTASSGSGTDGRPSGGAADGASGGDGASRVDGRSGGRSTDGDRGEANRTGRGGEDRSGGGDAGASALRGGPGAGTSRAGAGDPLATLIEAASAPAQTTGSSGLPTGVTALVLTGQAARDPREHQAKIVVGNRTLDMDELGELLGRDLTAVVSDEPDRLDLGLDTAIGQTIIGFVDVDDKVTLYGEMLDSVVELKSGNDTFDVVDGTITNSEIDLGEGDDSVSMMNVQLSGTTLRLGGGTDALEVAGTVTGTTFSQGEGNASVNLAGVFDSVEVDVGDGDDAVSFTGTATNTRFLTGDGDDVVVLVARGTGNRVSLGDDDDKFYVNGEGDDLSVDLGGGVDEVVIDADFTGSITINDPKYARYKRKGGVENYDRVLLNGEGWKRVPGASATFVRVVDGVERARVILSSDNVELVTTAAGEKLLEREPKKPKRSFWGGFFRGLLMIGALFVPALAIVSAVVEVGFAIAAGCLICAFAVAANFIPGVGPWVSRAVGAVKGAMNNDWIAGLSGLVGGTTAKVGGLVEAVIDKKPLAAIASGAGVIGDAVGGSDGATIEAVGNNINAAGQFIQSPSFVGFAQTVKSGVEGSRTVEAEREREEIMQRETFVSASSPLAGSPYQRVGEKVEPLINNLRRTTEGTEAATPARPDGPAPGETRTLDELLAGIPDDRRIDDPDRLLDRLRDGVAPERRVDDPDEMLRRLQDGVLPRGDGDGAGPDASGDGVLTSLRSDPGFLLAQGTMQFPAGGGVSLPDPSRFFEYVRGVAAGAGRIAPRVAPVAKAVTPYGIAALIIVIGGPRLADAAWGDATRYGERLRVRNRGNIAGYFDVVAAQARGVNSEFFDELDRAEEAVLANQFLDPAAAEGVLASVIGAVNPDFSEDDAIAAARWTIEEARRNNGFQTNYGRRTLNDLGIYDEIADLILAGYLASFAVDHATYVDARNRRAADLAPSATTYEPPPLPVVPDPAAPVLGVRNPDGTVNFSNEHAYVLNVYRQALELDPYNPDLPTVDLVNSEEAFDRAIGQLESIATAAPPGFLQTEFDELIARRFLSVQNAVQQGWGVSESAIAALTERLVYTSWDATAVREFLNDVTAPVQALPTIVMPGAGDPDRDGRIIIPGTENADPDRRVLGPDGRPVGSPPASGTPDSPAIPEGEPTPDTPGEAGQPGATAAEGEAQQPAAAEPAVAAGGAPDPEEPEEEPEEERLTEQRVQEMIDRAANAKQPFNWAIPTSNIGGAAVSYLITYLTDKNRIQSILRPDLERNQNEAARDVLNQLATNSRVAGWLIPVNHDGTTWGPEDEAEHLASYIYNRRSAEEPWSDHEILQSLQLKDDWADILGQVDMREATEEATRIAAEARLGPREGRGILSTPVLLGATFKEFPTYLTGTAIGAGAGFGAAKSANGPMRTFERERDLATKDIENGARLDEWLAGRARYYALPRPPTVVTDPLAPTDRPAWNPFARGTRSSWSIDVPTPSLEQFVLEARREGFSDTAIYDALLSMDQPDLAELLEWAEEVPGAYRIQPPPVLDQAPLPVPPGQPPLEVPPAEIPSGVSEPFPVVPEQVPAPPVYEPRQTEPQAPSPGEPSPAEPEAVDRPFSPPPYEPPADSDEPTPPNSLPPSPDASDVEETPDSGPASDDGEGTPASGSLSDPAEETPGTDTKGLGARQGGPGANGRSWTLDDAGDEPESGVPIEVINDGQVLSPGPRRLDVPPGVAPLGSETTPDSVLPPPPGFVAEPVDDEPLRSDLIRQAGPVDASGGIPFTRLDPSAVDQLVEAFWESEQTQPSEPGARPNSDTGAFELFGPSGVVNGWLAGYTTPEMDQAASVILTDAADRGLQVSLPGAAASETSQTGDISASVDSGAEGFPFTRLESTAVDQLVEAFWESDQAQRAVPGASPTVSAGAFELFGPSGVVNGWLAGYTTQEMEQAAAAIGEQAAEDGIALPLVGTEPPTYTPEDVFTEAELELIERRR